MNLKTHLKTAVFAGSLVGLLGMIFPATASAGYGWYHYSAWDMNINEGDWTSVERIKRMYWHPWTPGGTVAVIQVPTVYGAIDPWQGFHVQDYGFGEFVGRREYNEKGIDRVEILEVYRTKYPQSSPTSGEQDPKKWKQYATVTLTIYEWWFGYMIPVDYMSVQLEYRDKYSGWK